EAVRPQCDVPRDGAARVPRAGAAAPDGRHDHGGDRRSDQARDDRRPPRRRERGSAAPQRMRVAGTRAACLLVALLASAAAFGAPPSRPNVILILADDLGYGDLSSYGATDIATPNIDRIANEGIRFTDYYAPANVCSPSRAAMLTGRYPFRSGVNGVLFHDTPDGLPLDEITIAEALRDVGYRTGLVGKWHLGPSEAFMPWNQGFDVFFGVPHSNDEKNFFVWDGPRRIPE